MQVVGYCLDCDKVFDDDGTVNDCCCPECDGTNYTFYNITYTVASDV